MKQHRQTRFSLGLFSSFLMCLFISACDTDTGVAETASNEVVTEAAAVAELPTLIAEPEISSIEEIMAWWPGDYDNQAQLASLEAEGKPIWREDGTGEGGHIEVASHYRAIDLPAFGQNVLYVEELKHGKPDLMFRQRIYTLKEDESDGSLRVTLWTFKDKEKYVGAWQNLELIADLTPEEMSAFPRNCDLVIQPKENGKYHMPMNGRDCAFGENYFNYQVLLGPDSFWFRDKIVRLADDVPVSMSGNFTYHELDRIN